MLKEMTSQDIKEDVGNNNKRTYALKIPPNRKKKKLKKKKRLEDRFCFYNFD